MVMLKSKSRVISQISDLYEADEIRLEKTEFEFEQPKEYVDEEGHHETLDRKRSKVNSVNG